MIASPTAPLLCLLLGLVPALLFGAEVEVGTFVHNTSAGPLTCTIAYDDQTQSLLRKGTFHDLDVSAKLPVVSQTAHGRLYFRELQNYSGLVKVEGDYVYDPQRKALSGFCLKVVGRVAPADNSPQIVAQENWPAALIPEQTDIPTDDAYLKLFLHQNATEELIQRLNAADFETLKTATRELGAKPLANACAGVELHVLKAITETVPEHKLYEIFSYSTDRELFLRSEAVLAQRHLHWLVNPRTDRFSQSLHPVTWIRAMEALTPEGIPYYLPSLDSDQFLVVINGVDPYTLDCITQSCIQRIARHYMISGLSQASLERAKLHLCHDHYDLLIHPQHLDSYPHLLPPEEVAAKKREEEEKKRKEEEQREAEKKKRDDERKKREMK